MKLQLSIGLPQNPRTRPILEGKVKADGIELVTSVVPTTELFWRQLRSADFDVAELGLNSIMTAQARGDERWIGLPIFTTRRFFHAEILVRRDAGIASPADLRGKRIGIPEYQGTGAIWMRGILEEEFGVKPAEMEFWSERKPFHTHRSGEFKPPPDVTSNQIPQDKSIGSMMLSGELEAALYYLPEPNPFDRSTADLWNHPDFTPLFADPIAEAVRYRRKTGIYPINHGMVIRREIAETHPWVALNLLKAFNRANEMADRQRMEHVQYYLTAGLLQRDAKDALQTPLVQHGIVANRPVLETAVRYAMEQQLTPRLLRLEEIFAESTMSQ
ncbi:MAG: ABC transporter substrate-binding protein [Betaproteobacteria bacterium]|nr:ABC transporter substrate-binding protein [Betaproteobacteria bacterium]